jgi:hypothetical protein
MQVAKNLKVNLPLTAFFCANQSKTDPTATKQNPVRVPIASRTASPEIVMIIALVDNRNEPENLRLLDVRKPYTSEEIDATNVDNSEVAEVCDKTTPVAIAKLVTASTSTTSAAFLN